MCWAARQAGYKVATILFRGGQGLPITSGKLSYSGCWEDIDHIFKHLSKKYVHDADGNKRVPVFAFGCSLGANILGLYLGKASDRATEHLDGAATYATPWNLPEGHHYFYNNFRGLF